MFKDTRSQTVHVSRVGRTRNWPTHDGFLMRLKNFNSYTASRGFSATAELLVYFVYGTHINRICRHALIHNAP